MYWIVMLLCFMSGLLVGCALCGARRRMRDRRSILKALRMLPDNAAPIGAALNALAIEAHQNAVAHGFYAKGLGYSDRLNLLHEEVSELYGHFRKGRINLPCDKGIPITFEAEELADLIIRVVDLAAARGVRIGEAVFLKMAYNTGRPQRHGDTNIPGESSGVGIAHQEQSKGTE